MASYGLYTLLTATGTATGTELTCANNDRRTFQAVCTGTGAITADVVLEGSNNKTDWITLSTISLSGTAPQTGSFDHYSAWTYIRARTSNVTGTNASVTVTVSLNRLDSDFASSPIVPKWSLDASGNAVGLAGPRGAPLLAVSATSVSYSGGRMSSYVCAGVTFTVNYNADGSVSAVVGGGSTLTFTYNADGTMASAVWSYQ